MNQFIVLFFGFFFSFTLQAQNLHSDLRDLADFAPAQFPRAKLIVEAMTTQPERFFQAQPKDIYGIELYQNPRAERDQWVYPVIALFTFDRTNLYFRKFEVRVSDQVNSVTLMGEIALAQTRFSVQVGLIPRTLVLSDSVNGITKLLPLGVGGVDSITVPGKVRLLTPLIKNGAAQKKYVIAKRSNPPYYKGKPFIRISDERARPTAIGFHIEQNPVFVRGFDSHGCMRLRDKDLRELYQIVSKGPEEQLSVNIDFFVPEKNLHPYPEFTEYFKSVKNYGTTTRPVVKRDDWNLVIMERIPGIPPIDKIVNGDATLFLP
jgi:hypothetical protein